MFVDAGMGSRASVISVITASVPSDPVSSRVRSYPATSFHSRPPVRITSPVGSTASTPRT